jgi:hypothetical protein
VFHLPTPPALQHHLPGVCILEHHRPGPTPSTRPTVVVQPPTSCPLQIKLPSATFNTKIPVFSGQYFCHETSPSPPLFRKDFHPPKTAQK